MRILFFISELSGLQTDILFVTINKKLCQKPKHQRNRERDRDRKTTNCKTKQRNLIV